MTSLIQRQLFARSERVKGIDFHSTEPWILTTLYSGHVYIWSYLTQQILKTFELTDVPVRAGRFVERKNWIVCGSDDFQLRVYNYNTAEKMLVLWFYSVVVREEDRVPARGPLASLAGCCQWTLVAPTWREY